MSKRMIEKVVAIVVWIIGGYVWVSFGIWYVVAGVLLLHTVELFTKALAIAKEAGLSVIYTVFMTMVFGITWWKYVKEDLEKGL